MTQYKSIREWIAEGVNPVGYVSKTELVVESIHFERTYVTATVADGGLSFQKDLSLIVAPPAPKRLSDEELLQSYKSAFDIASEFEARSQILDRMKAKGPTRGEVAQRLQVLLELRDAETGVFRPSVYGEAYDTFLSMFPEGDQ